MEFKQSSCLWDSLKVVGLIWGAVVASVAPHLTVDLSGDTPPSFQADDMLWAAHEPEWYELMAFRSVLNCWSTAQGVKNVVDLLAKPGNVMTREEALALKPPIEKACLLQCNVDGCSWVASLTENTVQNPFKSHSEKFHRNVPLGTTVQVWEAENAESKHFVHNQLLGRYWAQRNHVDPLVAHTAKPYDANVHRKITDPKSSLNHMKEVIDAAAKLSSLPAKEKMMVDFYELFLRKDNKREYANCATTNYYVLCRYCHPYLFPCSGNMSEHGNMSAIALHMQASHKKSTITDDDVYTAEVKCPLETSTAVLDAYQTLRGGRGEKKRKRNPPSTKGLRPSASPSCSQGSLPLRPASNGSDSEGGPNVTVHLDGYLTTLLPMGHRQCWVFTAVGQPLPQLTRYQPNGLTQRQAQSYHRPTLACGSLPAEKVTPHPVPASADVSQEGGSDLTRHALRDREGDISHFTSHGPPLPIDDHSPFTTEGQPLSQWNDDQSAPPNGPSEAIVDTTSHDSALVNSQRIRAELTGREQDPGTDPSYQFTLPLHSEPIMWLPATSPLPRVTRVEPNASGGRTSKGSREELCHTLALPQMSALPQMCVSSTLNSPVATSAPTSSGPGRQHWKKTFLTTLRATGDQSRKSESLKRKFTNCGITFSEKRFEGDLRTSSGTYDPNGV